MNKITAFADDIPIMESSMSFGNQNQEQNGCPCKFCLLKYGKNRYTMAGQPPEEFEFTPEMAQKIIEEFNSRGRDLVIDYDHGTLNSAKYTGDAPASGWVEKFEMEPNRGLVAIVKKWQPKAQERMMNGEYRYFSPVLMMDAKTKAPYAIQSIGLTNHPAIHNLDALVAANDLSEKNARKELNDIFKKTISEMRDGLQSCQQLLPVTIDEYVKAFADDAEYVKDVQAFTESVMLSLAEDMGATPAPIQQSSDIMSVIYQKRDTMSGPQLLDWVQAELNNTTDASAKRVLEAEKNRLMAFKEQYPDLWNAGLTSGSSSTVQMLQPKPTIPVGLTDIIGETEPEKLVYKIKELNDFHNDAQTILKLHSVTSFTELNDKILEEKNELTKKLNDIQESEVKATAVKTVDEAIKSGKLTEAMRESAVEIAKANPKAFNDFIGKSLNKVAMVSLNSKVVEKEPLSKSVEVKAFSDDQMALAKWFGKKPEDILWTDTVPQDEKD